MTCFEHDREVLTAKLHSQVILTPHEGEFKRLFPHIKGNKLQKAITAALETRTTIVLKGPDTIIASPDQGIVIQSEAPSNLSTAGTGDVLAGIIASLLAQGMPIFEAACAAVWIHAESAKRIGHGLIAQDLISQIPAVMALLKTKQ